MVSSLLDVCRFNPAAGSTTDWTYSSAVTGYQSPTAAGVVNAATYSYRAESNDLSQWEIGTGAYNTGTGVLARTAVLFNSSGGTSKINFSTVPQVAIVALAEDVGSVTSVVGGTGLSGGTITRTGTLAVSLSTLTNTLGADVALSSTGSYFAGPTVAQGSSGTWLAVGSVVCQDTTAQTFYAKLHDGTNIAASGAESTGVANGNACFTLVGIFTSPPGNIRIDCRQPFATTGSMKFNSSGNSKDCSITVVRIA